MGVRLMQRLHRDEHDAHEEHEAHDGMKPTMSMKPMQVWNTERQVTPKGTRTTTL